MSNKLTVTVIETDPVNMAGDFIFRRSIKKRKEQLHKMREENRIPSCQRLYAEISLDAIRSNLEQMKKGLSPKTKMIAVVKADGYGHGAIPIARELENFDGLWGFAAATAEEAVLLREAGITAPILVLGYTFPCCYERMIEEEIRITVFRQDTLAELSDAYKELAKRGIHKKAKVHIKVDTGMNRIGIKPVEKELGFVDRAFQTEGIEVEGIFTHFARADEADKAHAERQLLAFQDFLGLIEEKRGYRIPMKHCSNSAAIMELPDANMDAVRAGVAMYGLWPSDEMRKDRISLTPALSLFSRIVCVKEIERGEAVSYGGCFVANKRMRIATVPAGYGDGYSRGLSGKGFVLICGKRAPILGRICMDQFMADVTDIPEAGEGTLVTLIGRDGAEEITMELLGELSGRFNYEFACCLGKRMPRVYVKDGRFSSLWEENRNF